MKNRKPAKPTLVTCSRCDGEGCVELTGPLADTLHLLRLQEEEVTGARLASLADIRPTAMNNRLVLLETYGLAIGRRYGRERLWKAT